MKNIRGMMKVFKRMGARSNPDHFMGSTMGAAEWEKFSGLNLDEVEYARIACTNKTKRVMKDLR